MITEINNENKGDINKPNQPFEVIGKIIPIFHDGVWSFTEMLFDNPYSKSYPIDDEQYEDYIDNPNKVIFLYYEANECLGQIIIKKNWNRYAYIHDIAVAQKARGKGVGAKLIHRAIEWAKDKNLCGLMLETQDNNLTACRFYKKNGFKIGGVDTMLYAGFDNADEKAVFWYLKF